MSNIQNAYTAPAGAAANAISFAAPDLTRHPPRSPRTRLGGYVHLPRLIDKARAQIAGTSGDYHFDCPMDKRFWAFTGIAPEAMFAEVKTGKSDSELLAFVQAAAKKHPSEVAEWSRWFEQLTPTNPDGREFFNEIHRKNAPQREDIATWFDWLELDDYVTFGGRP